MPGPLRYSPSAGPRSVCRKHDWGSQGETISPLLSIETWPNPTGRGSTYHLTEAGSQLGALVGALGIWGQNWLEIQPEHLDSDFLMWRILKHLNVDKLPPQRRVVRFEFRDEKKRYWLVLRRDDPDLCYSDPGFGEDLVIRTDLEAVTRVYLGQLRLADARRCGLLEIEGPRELARGVDAWFPVSGFAAHVRAVKYDRDSRSFRRIDTSASRAPARLATK